MDANLNFQPCTRFVSCYVLAGGKTDYYKMEVKENQTTDNCRE